MDIAEMGLALDPSVLLRRSNYELIPWTWTMKLPVFIAKLEGWDMYVSPPFFLISYSIYSLCACYFFVFVGHVWNFEKIYFFSYKLSTLEIRLDLIDQN